MIEDGENESLALGVVDLKVRISSHTHRPPPWLFTRAAVRQTRGNKWLWIGCWD